MKLSFECQALHLISDFLSLFLSEVEKKRKHQRNTETDKNNIEQKINTELALYPLSHILMDRRHHRTPRPHFHPVSEIFCFWQIRKKAEKKHFSLCK